MSSNLKVNTILPSTGTNVAIGTAGGSITMVGNVDIDINSGISTFNDIHISDKIVHDGDTNTSIRFPSSDTITFETSGQEAFRIDSNRISNFRNKVIIDDGSNGHLFLNNTSTDNTIHSGTTGFSAYKNLVINAAQHIFKVSNTEKVRIDTNGRLLIGTDTSAYKLCVADNTNASLVSQVVNLNTGSSTKSIFQIQTGSNRYVNFENDYTGQYVHVVGSGISTYFSSFDTHRFRNNAGTERVRIEPGGNIVTTNTVGHVLLGLDASRTINSHAPRLQLTGTTYSHATASIINNEANGNGAYLFLGKQRSGAIGGNTAVQSNDIIGELRFPAGDGTDMENYAARIMVHADQNASSNNTSGYIDIYTTRRNGSSHRKLRIGQNSSHGTQFSFGTETSDLNNTNTGDRTSLKVGPATHIEGVFGHNGTSGMYYNCYSGGNDLFYRGTRAPSNADWRPAAYGQKYGSHYFYGDPSNTAYSAQAQVTTMQTNMTISREGYVKKPYQPSFLVAPANDAETANGYGVYTTVFHNTGNHYSTSNGRFTAPVTGYYNFGANYVGAAACTNVFVRFYINGAVNQRGQHYSGGGVGAFQASGSPYMSCDLSGTHTLLQAGDYVNLHLAATSATQAQSGYMRFYGYLVH